ncbi:MAG: rhomboid family intramembrane serine protease [Nocardioides sp.]|nr:rhomboid family intramembrane serine protease [Nocardioides sp.]
MHPAAVGFQCPSCVKEGARSVRQPRAPYGGRRSANPALTSQVIIALNAAVWLLITTTGGMASAWLDRLGLIPAGRCEVAFTDRYFPELGSAAECSQATMVTGNPTIWLDGVASGAVWQLLSSAFTHVDIWHIGVNMLAVWFLAPQLEAVMGRARFLALYLLSALAGSLFVVAFSAPAAMTIGASGAVFGLLGGLLVVVLKVRADPRQLLLWLGINVVITIAGASFISWQAHLGGFLGGVLVTGLLVLAPRARRGVWQAVGLGVLALVLVAATVAAALTVG